MVETSAPRTATDVRALRYDAGTPVLNLVATVGRRGTTNPIERLTESTLGSWLSHMGLAAELGDLDQLHALRESTRRLLEATADSSRPRADDVHQVNSCAGRQVAAQRLILTGADGVTVTTPPQDALGVLARDAIALLADRRLLDRLRRCDAHECRMFYLDTSQGHRRRWCSMQRCGNRAKAAQHRQTTGPSQ